VRKSVLVMSFEMQSSCAEDVAPLVRTLHD